MSCVAASTFEMLVIILSMLHCYWGKVSQFSCLQVTDQGFEVWLCMADPSNNPHRPGWPLQNMLLMAAKRWQVTNLSVLCVRDQQGKLDMTRSLCLSVVLPPIPSGIAEPYLTILF